MRASEKGQVALVLPFAERISFALLYCRRKAGDILRPHMCGRALLRSKNRMWELSRILFFVMYGQKRKGADAKCRKF